MASRYDEREQKVAVTAARESASLAIIRHSAAGMAGMEGLLKGRLRKSPITVYDINGTPLFYDFPVTGREGGNGFIRTAASRILGSPVIAVELGARKWNFQAAVRKLLPRVKRGRKNVRLSRPKLVCYGYPKLGVMFEVPDARGKIRRQIFDVASLKPVPELPPQEQREGNFAWSYYDSLDNRKRSSGLRKFAKLDSIRIKQPATFSKKLERVNQMSQLTAVAQLKFKRTVTKTMEFCPHYGTSHARSHHCFVLHGQQVDDYCAVATCQMILCYYRYYFGQNDIAPSLNYSAGSGCPADQSAGYESLSNNHIIATFDNSATWSEARSQIDQRRPMKSGVPGHARAVAGYSYVWNLWPSSITERKLYVYDPWPWDPNYATGGSLYWEDWDTITHTNFIYTRLDY